MNFKKIILASLLTTIFIPTFNYWYQYNPTHEEYKNFEEDEVTAKEWAEEKWAEWNKNLSLDNISELKKYVFFGELINNKLRESKGNFFTENITALYEEWNKAIKVVDKTLKDVKVPENMLAYRRVHENIFNIKLGTLRENGKIDQGFERKIREKYIGKEFIEYGYLSTSISNMSTTTFNENKQPILMKLKIPRGSHAAYLSRNIGLQGENELLIARNYSIKYENMKITNGKTSEILEVEALLILK